MKDIAKLVFGLPGFKKRFVIFVVAVILAQGVAIQILPFVEREMITIVQGAGTDSVVIRSFLWLGMIAALVTVTVTVLNRVSYFMAAVLRNEVWHGVFNAGFAKLIYHDLEYLSQNRSSGLLNKVVRASYKLADLFTESASAFFRNATRALVSLIILFALSWQIGLGVLATLMFYMVIYRYRFKLDKPLSEEKDRLEEEDFSRVYEVVPQVKLVKIFTNEEREIGELVKMQKLFIENTRKREWLWNYANIIELPLVNIPTIAITFYAAWQAMQGVYGLPTLVLILSMIRAVQDPMWVVNWFMWEMQFTYNRAKKYQKILKSTVKVKDLSRPVKFSKPGGNIVLDKVEFSYDKSDGKVLDKFSAVFLGGKTTALVGRSGAGKTTITNLISRFFDPNKGKILIGGIDIRTLSIADLRGEIGFVLQESYVFSGTVAENMRYADEDATDSQIEDALRKSHAWEFVEGLKDGVDTEIGERGVKLSGGQRQRLAIARMILKDPRIVILDEATNALDSESEIAVQAALEEFMKDKTVIVVAHRLSTVQKSDQILVIDGGKVQERGTHKQLVAKGGIYSMLWDIQSGGYERQREIMESYEME